MEERHISPALRGALKKSIDNFIRYPQKNKTLITEILKRQGIEPTLEAILSYHTGFLYGIITRQFSRVHERMPNTDERRTITDIIKGRMREMREALVDPR